MNMNPKFGLYAVAVAIVVLGALWFGVPAGTLVVLGVALACPVMMMFMMGGMHGGGDHPMSGGHDRDDHESHRER
jgi:hypothetical protein